MHELALVDKHVEVVVQTSGAVHLLNAKVGSHGEVDCKQSRVYVISVLDVDENENDSVTKSIERSKSAFVAFGKLYFTKDFDVFELFRSQGQICRQILRL